MGDIDDYTMNWWEDNNTNLTSANPVPKSGEPIYITDLNKYVIGDGSTAYNSLKKMSILEFQPFMDSLLESATLATMQTTLQIIHPTYYSYDLSGGSDTHTLPDATVFLEEVTINWTGGTFGVDYLTINTYLSQTIDGTSSYIGEGDNRIVLISDGSNWHIKNIFRPLRLKMQHQESAGTDGGNSTGGSWQTRDLNTTVEINIPGASHDTVNDDFDLPAGTYTVKTKSMYFATGHVSTRIYNTSDSNEVAHAVNEYAQSAEQVGAQSEIVETKFTITATKTFELQYRVSSSRAGNGLGIDNNFSGETQIYADVVIEKIA